MIVEPDKISTQELHGYLLGAIAPRPIAFASTVDKSGNINLSPFSFFNVFSANPPTLIFSPARRVRDNTTKHTLDNVLEHPEVVINVVSYDIVQQMSLASAEFDQGINEFEKSGLTPVESDLVKPPRVKESPVSIECKVVEVKHLGSEGGAGNLVICEVLRMHISDRVLNDSSKIDPFKLDAVARMGGNWYCRAQGRAIFEVAKPSRKGIGIDSLPEIVKSSSILTGNNLGKLGNIDQLPGDMEVTAFAKEPEVSAILEAFTEDDHLAVAELHKLAQEYLEHDDVEGAWKVLLQHV